MTRVVFIGTGAEGLQAALAALSLASVRIAAEFRELVQEMGVIDVPEPFPPALPAPKFGSDRPYLKKTKGRP